MDVLQNLAPDPHAPARARAALDQLHGRIGEGLLNDLRLVVSELVTNAVEHGPCDVPIELKVSVDGPERLRAEVADQGDGTVEIRESADEGGGWGLRLVETLADRWGVHPGSTHVWVELSGRRRADR